MSVLKPLGLLTVLPALSLLSPHVDSKPLFYDDFETGVGSHWLSDERSKNRITVSRYLDNSTLKLSHRSFAASKISTQGYRNVRFQASVYGSSLENQEQCKLQSSVDDGSSWLPLAGLSNGEDDGLIDGGGNRYWAVADDHPGILLRASINGNERNDSCFFDNIKITGEKIYPQSQQLNVDGMLASDVILGKDRIEQAVPYSAFYQADQAPAKYKFNGRLQFAPGQTFSVQLIEDSFAYESDQKTLRYNEFPGLAVDLVQSGDDLIPLARGPQPTAHPHWELIVEAGKTWQPQDQDLYSRAALPFSLQQKGANCVHNGLLTFLYNDQGDVSRTVFQIGSETCAYFKFDAWGSVPTRYTKDTIAETASIVARFLQEQAERIPQLPISALQDKYPQVDVSKIGSEQEVHASNMTAYGMVVDGINYVGGCGTRFGDYPFCDVLDLPSYSTAKSVSGLAYIRMVKLHPEIKGKKLVDLIPACKQQAGWQDVTIEDALNMTTGHYDSDGYEVDEFSSMIPFFDTNTHAGKVAEACRYPKKMEPGKKWVYHTSDTYLLGTALQNFWQQKHGPKADYFRDTMMPIWRQMGLSPMMNNSRRTYDERAQVYAGYGLTYHRGDIAKLASELVPNAATLDKYQTWFDRDELKSALQMDNTDRGVTAAKNTKYKHAFWAYNAQAYLACSEPVWIPFMSGFGGNTVAMLPNGIAYYVFSDNHDYVWKQAVLQANKIKPLCGAKQ